MEALIGVAMVGVAVLAGFLLAFSSYEREQRKPPSERGRGYL